MAIDSAEKRRSAAGVAFLPLGPGVTPNASKDVEWRQQSAWSYSGIAPTQSIALDPPALVYRSRRIENEDIYRSKVVVQEDYRSKRSNEEIQ